MKGDVMEFDRKIILALCVLILLVTAAAASAYMNSDSLQRESREIGADHAAQKKSSNDNSMLRYVQWDNV